MTLLRTTLLSSLLATVVLGASAAPRTEVIPLNYRTADDVMAVAQSVIGSEGKVTAYGNQLIVNAEPAKIRELQSVLQQIDSRPHRLLITVDTSENLQQDSRGYSVDGSASAGNIEIQSGRGEVNGKDRVRIIRRSTDSRSGGSQQVQATEGYPALIQVGQSVPITSTATGPYGQIYSQTEYRNVNRGFYVTATLTGNLVHVTPAMTASARAIPASSIPRAPTPGSAASSASGSPWAASANRTRPTSAASCVATRPRDATTPACA